MGTHKGKIKEIKRINENVYSIKFSSPFLKSIIPGQYISILCDGLTLRRPFSVSDFDGENITILIKLRGKGTQYLSNLKIGDDIDFCGPLGNGFKLTNKKTLLIGAGIGVAPLFYAEKKLKGIGAKTLFAASFPSEIDIINRELIDFISTDDCSNGIKGSICDYLEKIIIEFKPEILLSCAPKPVLKFVSELAQKYNIPSEICMEKTMACGIGVCRGCVIKIKKNAAIQNATVCKDGPVFAGEEVVW